MSQILNDAVRALRADRVSEELAPSVRAGIIEQALHPSSTPEPLRTLFVPTWKIALTMGFSFALTAGLAAGTWLAGPVRPEQGVTLVASKVGDRVVFDVLDGNGTHQVTKSMDVTDFQARPVTIEGGRFQDLIQSGPVLVFYKVD